MDPKNIRGRDLSRLARLKPNTGHARNLRAKLGITSEPVVEEAPAPVPAPTTRKKTSKKISKKATPK